MGPLVELQVPFRGETFVADHARIWLAARVSFHVHFDRGLKVYVIAFDALNVFVQAIYVRYKIIVVGSSYVSGER